QAEESAVDGRLVAAEQGFEGVAVAGAGARHFGSVGVRGFDGRASGLRREIAPRPKVRQRSEPELEGVEEVGQRRHDDRFQYLGLPEAGLPQKSRVVLAVLRRARRETNRDIEKRLVGVGNLRAAMI